MVQISGAWTHAAFQVRPFLLPFRWRLRRVSKLSAYVRGLVMAFLPQSYTVVASSRVEEEIQRLAEALAQTEAAAASPLLDQFSRDNQALVILTGEAGSQSFGSLPSEAVDNALTTSLEVTFADSDSPYALSVTAPVSPGRELTLAFLEKPKEILSKMG